MILDRLQAVPWRGLPFWLTGNRLRIVMYHSIADNPQDPHAVRPKDFVRQMEALTDQRYQVISLAEGLRRLRQRLPLRGRVVLTFDDAYRDFLANALPVLDEFGFPATLFAPTGLLGGTAIWDSYDKSKRLMDWDELQEVNSRGVTVASHTVTHARLTECDDQQLEYELRSSLETLRERLSDVFSALSYPGGYYGSREIEVARLSGYVCAVSLASRWGTGPNSDLYQLRRERPFR